MTDDKLVQRSIYVSDDEWSALKILAEKEGRSRNNYLLTLLRTAIIDEAAVRKAVSVAIANAKT